MAKLQATSLKVIGNASSGIDIEIKTDIVFSNLDKQLDVVYYVQGFVYDVDGEEDIMMPLINELHCQLDVEQVKDSYSNKDDMIYNKQVKVIRQVEVMLPLVLNSNYKKTQAL